MGWLPSLSERLQNVRISIGKDEQEERRFHKGRCQSWSEGDQKRELR